MKKIYTLPLVLLFMSFSLWLSAQQQLVKGTVTDASDGSPLIGVNVIVAGTTNGTITDFDGMYELMAPIDGQLNFTYVGFGETTVAINGQSIVDLVLSQGLQLNEVVVTALGRSKESKELGYAVEQLNAEEIANSGKSDVVSALQGKISGVQIQGSSGAPGAGSSILIRGITSLDPTRSNRPLYVIDGIEINDDVDVVPTKPIGADYGVGSGNGTQGSVSNRMMDINPDNIESISVLKGAQATALYGVRAANGAIIITTKKGKSGIPTVELNLGTGFSQVNRFPKVQRQFMDGHRSTSKKRSNIWDNWGPEVTDSHLAETHNVYEDFYQKGSSKSIGASITAGNDKFTYRLSSGYDYSEGVVPFSDFKRANFSLNTGYKISDNFDINTTFSYSNSGGKTPHEGRKSVGNVLAYTANVVNTKEYHKPYTAATNFAAGWIDHPLFLAEKNTNISNVNRILGSINLGYKIAKGLKLNYSLGVDTYSDARERIVHPETDEGASGVKEKPFGFVVNNNINKTSLTSNLYATYEKPITDKLNMDVTIGQYAYGWDKKINTIIGESFLLDNFFNLNNTLVLGQSNKNNRYRNLALYGEIGFSYDNYLYFTFNSRNDRTSTLPKKNNSYFFPGASVSWVLSDMLTMPSSISFAKLRASWAKVGKDASIYQIGRYYANYKNFNEDIIEFAASSLIGDENLRPEFSTTLEFGGDFAFLNSRLGLEMTYYTSKTTDMILPVPLSNTSGASRFVTNGGSMTNTGIEITSYVDVLKDFAGFDWRTSLNWSTNTGIVDEISIDADEIVVNSNRNITSKYIVGGKIGDLYGAPFKRTDDGDLIIGSNGYPSMNWDTTVLMGNAMPDWIAGLTNDISYKGFGLSFLWEWKKGGKAIDISRNYSIGNGQLEETNGRYQSVIFKGVKEDADGNYVENDIETEIEPASFYRGWKVYRFAPEVYLQDASWVRLRNLSVYYNLPESWLSSIFISKARLTFTANNAFLSTPFRGWDPESNYYGPSSNIYGWLGMRTPQTKAFNFRLNITF